MKRILQRLVPVPRKAVLTNGHCRWDGAALSREQVRDMDPEGYRLLITDGNIRVEASGEKGFHMADQTLRQLRLLTDATCPCLEIEDEPALPIRGYMLDISRCKVPTMDHLFRLVDLLSLFKYNQFQLYMEHTFAYRGHEVVWQDASPMTGPELGELKDYCAERHIELVPNQNAFGHMDRWLRHDDYHHLAECPYGFEHPIAGWKSNGSVLCPDMASLEFVDGLLDQLLPYFNSDWVHLGCDEPWELGQGRSESRILEVGRHAVYQEYLTGLNSLLDKRGKRMLFWSDELREEPGRIKALPESMVPVVWGYERDHPFDEECQVYGDVDREFIIAPGDSSWNSHSARLDTAFPNIRRAALCAKKNGAMGLLLTSWGDNGHQQVWPAQLGGLVMCSAAAWNPSSIDELDLADALNRFAFLDPTDALGQFWHDFGQLDTRTPVRINPLNSSFSHDALHAPDAKIHHALKSQPKDCLFAAFDWLVRCQKELARAKPAVEDAEWLLEESRLALDMAFGGLRRAEAILKGEGTRAAFSEWASVMDRFSEVWLRRNRPGGLDESREALEQCPCSK